MIKDTVGEKDQSLTDIIITNPLWKMLMYFFLRSSPFCFFTYVSLFQPLSPKGWKKPRRREEEKKMNELCQLERVHC